MATNANLTRIERSEAAAAARDRMLRSGPIVPTLARLSLPNLIALCSSAVVSIAETAYVSSLGVASLGGIALAFPVFMLMQMLSAGAMGGTVSGAISRAYGAGDPERAQALALSAVVIALVLGGSFSLAVRFGGPSLYATLGGSGAVLDQAIAYSNVAAFAIAAIWLTNLLASIARGSGDMAVPALVILSAGLVQVAVGGTLGLGLGQAPRLGMVGVALGQVAAFVGAVTVLFFYLRSSRARQPLQFSGWGAVPGGIREIMRVGFITMLSPIFSVATIFVLTRMVAAFGPAALAGFGIGVRFEFLLIPIAFSVGVACVPMVGTAIGAADIARARRIAWTAGSIAAAILGALGLIVIALPGVWVDLFTGPGAVQTVAYQYLRIAGLGYAFFGLGLCLYFASQGAGRVGGAIIAQGLRLLFVVAGGLVLAHFDTPLWAVFVLAASAMIPMGLGTALFVKFSRW